MLEKKTITPTFGPAQDIYRAGKGEPLVFLHGFTGIKPEDAFLGALAASFDVVAPAMPGRKDLGELEDMHDIRDVALYYDSLLDELGLERVTLVGHSFGGMLAGEMAALAPGRIKRLALISPLGLWNDEAPIADAFARPYAMIEELLWKGASVPPSAKPAGESETVDSLVELANGLGSIAKYVWPLPDKGLRRRLYRVTMPTLVVFGEQDALVPVFYADEFTRAIPDARKLVLKGSHMIPYERPQEIAEAIRAL